MRSSSNCSVTVFVLLDFRLSLRSNELSVTIPSIQYGSLKPVKELKETQAHDVPAAFREVSARSNYHEDILL